MVTKKPANKPVAKVPAKPAGRPKPKAKAVEAMPEAPGTEDPEQQARYFMELLESLERSGDAEARKIRLGLIAFIAEYREEKKQDPKHAQEIALTRLVSFEIGLSEVLLKSTRKIHDQLAKESKKLGTGSPQGKSIRQAAEGFGSLVEALDMMLESARKADMTMRAEAHKKLAQAKALVEEWA